VTPADTMCAMPNSTHLVVQLQVSGAVYRMVVNVLSDGRNGTDTRVRAEELHHALVGTPFAEGWHTGVALDYATTLGAHSTTGFTPYAMNDLIGWISTRLEIGAHLSAYATSSGGASAHLVHRNVSNQDGALVIGPDSSDPVFLLFAFDGDVF
jgi:hypothetical protein